MRPGDRLANRYLLGARIGQGGMGEVWRGEQVALGRPVAIKVIRREQSQTSPELRDRFQREAELAAKVEHRNVIDIIDYGTTEDGDQFLVMPLLRGENLHERLRREPKPTALEVLRWTRALLGGLGAIHAARIIHRDLKPANVFLAEDADGVVPKLLDFGISRTAEATGTGLTQLGTAIGTPQYMAPEQFESARDVDERADLYSVGAILYEAFAGRPPYDAADAFAIYRKILQSDPAPLCEVRDDLPAELGALVDRAIAKDPSARFESARAMRDAIDALAASGVVPDVSASSIAGPRTPDPALALAPTTPAAEAIADAARTPRRAPKVPATVALDPSSQREIAAASPPLVAAKARRTSGLALALGVTLALVGAGATAWTLTREPPPPPVASADARDAVEETTVPATAAAEPSVSGHRVAGPEDLHVLALRWARLEPADRPREGRFVRDAGEWSLVVDDLDDEEATRLAALFDAEPVARAYDASEGLRPSLVHTTVRLNLHVRADIASETSRIVPHDTLAVALDGELDGATSAAEGEDARRFVVASRDNAGWVVARYLVPHLGCVPLPGPLVRDAPAAAAAIRRDVSVARTHLDVSGQRHDAYVMSARDRDHLRSYVGIYEAERGAGCGVGSRIALYAIDGVLDEHFLTDTAPIGGWTLLFVSWSSTATMPSDGVLSWAGYKIEDEVYEIFRDRLASAAFLESRRAAAVSGTRDAALRDRAGYVLRVRREDGTRTFYRWDDESYALVEADPP